MFVQLPKEWEIITIVLVVSDDAVHGEQASVEIIGEALALEVIYRREVTPPAYCLVGANGAGKTTTISLSLNFISPTSGSTFVNGINFVEQLIWQSATLLTYLRPSHFIVSFRAWRISITLRLWLVIVSRNRTS